MFTVRKAFVSEYFKYATHLKALDNQSRYSRFTYIPSDAAIDQFVDSVIRNSDKNVLFVVEEYGSFIAVGHIAIGNSTELALSVLKEYQGQGLGNMLMRRMVDYCRANNHLNGYMTCLSSNQAIKHLCQKYDIRINVDGSDSVGQVKFKSPTALTYIVEEANSNLETATFFSKRLRDIWASVLRLYMT